MKELIYSLSVIIMLYGFTTESFQRSNHHPFVRNIYRTLDFPPSIKTPMKKQCLFSNSASNYVSTNGSTPIQIGEDGFIVDEVMDELLGDSEEDINDLMNNYDYRYEGESLLGESVSSSINKMIATAHKEGQSEMSPVEKFQGIYEDIKSSKSKSERNDIGNKPDASKMLEDLFSDTMKPDPFDDKKVMFKLKELLGDDDFKKVFVNDPAIGDWI